MTRKNNENNVKVREKNLLGGEESRGRVSKSQEALTRYQSNKCSALGSYCLMFFFVSLCLLFYDLVVGTTHRTI